MKLDRKTSTVHLNFYSNAN